MNYAEISIVKRDGKKEDFSISKIKNAITKAFNATGITNEDKLIADITMQVIAHFTSSTISVEAIQDLVEKELMKVRPEVAKKYIIYREWRNTERDKKTQMKHIMDGIVAIDKNDINLSNANMSSHTPAGQMMTFASEVTKDYTYRYLLPKRFAEAHQLGDIHIHDLDYYPTKTTTCIQYDMDDLFERGFRTKNGSIRTPQSIQSYATLATIIFQTNQNEQHGGQAIPAFDFFMAKGVYKSFIKHLMSGIDFYISLLTNHTQHAEIKECVSQHVSSIDTDSAGRLKLCQALADAGVTIELPAMNMIFEKAYAQTRKDTHQAMEGFIHNLNTMHSRGGNQVVFSSINYGTDTSAEGRMVIEELLKATTEGLGARGEVPVFPIQIFKVKDGVSYSEQDYKRAMENFEEAIDGNMQFNARNFDLFLKACRTTAKALFPNFMFLDTPYNTNDKWQANDPKRYRYELATMGCRTRVYENIAGEKSSLGRGNLSFTTINMPRLAMEARIKAENMEESGNKDAIEQKAKEYFIESVLGGSLYFLFAFVPMFLAYSATLIDPEMVARLIDSDSQMILPELVLSKAPLFAQVMFFGALLSAIKSCASATLLAPSVTFTENILKPALPHLTDKKLLFWMRVVTLIFTVLVTLYAMFSKATIFKMVENAYQITLVSAFIPLLCGLYWRRATNQGALASIFGGIAVWLGVHLAGGDDPFVPAQLAGLIASVVGMIVGSLVKQWVPHDIGVHDRLRHGHHAADAHGVAHEGVGVVHRH